MLCNPAFPPLIPLSHAASAISHGLVRCFLIAAPAPRLNTCSQVVAMEMRQCEYRAVIPSALACGSNSSFFGSVFSLIWSVFTSVLYFSVYVLVAGAAAFVVSALTGYGSRFVTSLPEVPNAFCLFAYQSDRLLACACSVFETFPEKVHRKPQTR